SAHGRQNPQTAARSSLLRANFRPRQLAGATTLPSRLPVAEATGTDFHAGSVLLLPSIKPCRCCDASGILFRFAEFLARANSACARACSAEHARSCGAEINRL